MVRGLGLHLNKISLFYGFRCKKNYLAHIVLTMVLDLCILSGSTLGKPFLQTFFRFLIILKIIFIIQGTILGLLGGLVTWGVLKHQRETFKLTSQALHNLLEEYGKNK
jgi:uncharacterized membrane protein